MMAREQLHTAMPSRIDPGRAVRLAGYGPVAYGDRHARSCDTHRPSLTDPTWLAVHRAIAPLLTAKDAVLAPRGAWPPFPCPVRFYDATIAIEDESVFVLHKGRMPALPKAALAAVVAGWRCLFANEVFLVFARPSGRRRWPSHVWPSDHLRRVHQHLRSRALKTQPSTLYYVHVPKTGGTAAWEALSRLFTSKVYYTDMETLHAHPPEPGEYDLVGLHGPPALIGDQLRPGDRVIGLLRDPIERFFSTVTHCRRPQEDPLTFTPAQRAMRDRPVADVLASAFGREETRLQTVFLGLPFPPRPAMPSTDALLDNALALIDRPDTLFAPLEAAETFLRQVLAGTGRRPHRLGRPNRNAVADYEKHHQEFRAALPQLEAMSVHDRRLFEAVVARFGARAG